MLKTLYHYILISMSGMFDRQYNQENYPDVRRSGQNPLMHFIKYGWQEGKNPSATFITRLYLELHPDVENAEVNPLIHYIQRGKKEGGLNHGKEQLGEAPFSNICTR